MKTELTCGIVEDLLPNYIEKLTGDDTNNAIEAHLAICEDCQKAYQQMAAEISEPEKVPTIELKFLKKVKKTRLLAAALSVILTLVLSYLIYASEYTFTNDKGNLGAGITDYLSSARTKVDAYVLETKEIDGVLVVSFKDQTNNGIYGVAMLKKGFNQRYRIFCANVESFNYSSVVQLYRIEIKDQPYIAVNGYNLSDQIIYYGLDYATYANPGYLYQDRVEQSLKYPVKNSQFLEIYPVEELNSLLEKSAEGNLASYYLVETSLYDADGREITENFIGDEDADQDIGFGVGTAELFLLYVFIAIIIGLGIIFTRYFLT